jgi:hypothetical protein
MGAFGDGGQLTRAPQIVTYTKNATNAEVYVVPDRVFRIVVDIIAGGGGGGGASTATGAQISPAAGGASGGFARKTFDVTPGMRFSLALGNLVVGNKGTGGAAGANNGTAGSDSTFTGPGSDGVPILVTTKGGNGGSAGGAAGTVVLLTAPGDSGAISTNGDVNSSGNPGAPGVRVSSTVGMSGAGACGVYGGGARGIAGVTGAGTAAKGPGGGGTGGFTTNNGAQVAGGDGAEGLVIIYEYAG